METAGEDRTIVDHDAVVKDWRWSAVTHDDADRDLRDCAAKGLSDDWRLAIADNAALQCAAAALAASGYRASRESHHFRVIQSLSIT